MEKIAIIGSDGQLGTDLMSACRERGVPVIGLTRDDIEVTDARSTEAALSASLPGIVINTAACQGASTYTTADQSIFFDVNALGVWNVARWCGQHGCTLVHYSTDYVFGGDAARQLPYTEEDLPFPVNAYGNSKVAGEYFVRAYCPQHYVVRVASLYGSAGCLAKNRSNFVKMVLGKAARGEVLEVVADQVMSPTWSAMAAAKTLDLVDSPCDWGIYHMAGSGSCSWYEFAIEIVRVMGANVEVRPVTTAVEGPDSIFLRPRYTPLDNAKIRRAGLDNLPPWQEALASFVRKEMKE